MVDFAGKAKETTKNITRISSFNYLGIPKEQCIGFAKNLCCCAFIVIN